MTRIILPLAVIAALLFGPLYSYESNDRIGGNTVTEPTGQTLVGNTVACFLGQNFSLEGDCEPKGTNKSGHAIFGAIFVSAAAAAIGILGLLPFVGRLTSLLTTIAGIAAIGAIGYFCMQVVGEPSYTIGWGSYVAGGAGLLTLISGLSGMRGNG